jgi:DNA-3-methyladenine glycosylase II
VVPSVENALCSLIETVIDAVRRDQSTTGRIELICPTMPPDTRAEAQAAHEHLLSADPRLAVLVAAQGPVDPYVWPGIPVADGDLLGGLVLHIVSQQISTPVALVLFDRVTTLLGDRIDAAGLIAADEEQLRAAGLTYAKARTLRGLGESVQSGTLDLAGLGQLDNAAAQARLTALRGIGPWSSQMFLLHELRRPDVFPSGDVALRAAIARLDGLPVTPGPREAAVRAEVWRPYRSYASAHLWAANRDRPGG